MRPTKVKMSPFHTWAGIFNNTEGRFFSVVYKKKDGTERKLNGRIYEKIDTSQEHDHLVVTDVHVERDERGNKVRKVNPATIIGFKCGDLIIGPRNLFEEKH